MQTLLNGGKIVIHPFIVAALALGRLQDRGRTLALLDWLPRVKVAQTSELRLMIESRRLYGRGLGLTDVHLLASVLIDPPARLWTRDKRLRKVAEELGLHVELRQSSS